MQVRSFIAVGIIGAFANSGAVFISTLILARTLGATDFGAYAVAIAALQVFVYAADFGGSRFANTLLVARDPQLARPSFANAVWYAVVLGVTARGVATALPAPPAWISVFGVDLAALTAAMMVGRAALGGILMGQQRIVAFNIANAARAVFLILSSALIVFVAPEQRRDAAALAFTAAAAVHLVTTIGFLTSVLSLRPSLRLLGESTKLGFRGCLVEFLVLAHLRIDLFFVSRIAGLSAAGVYGLAVTVGDVLSRIPNIIGNTIFPLSAAGRLDREKQLAPLVRLAMTAAVGLGLPMVFAAFLFVPLTLGAEYAGVWPILLALVPAIAFLSGMHILWGYLTGLGLPLIAITATSLSVLTNILLNIILIPAIGGIGAAIASSISYALAFSLMLRYGVSLGEVPVRLFLRLRSDDLRHLASVAIQFGQRLRRLADR